MGATVMIDGQEATISNYVWASTDQELERILTSITGTDAPSGADPAPDYHAALAAVKMMGGEVTEFTLPKYVDGRVY